MTVEHSTGAPHSAPLNSREVMRSRVRTRQVGLLGIALTGLLALSACDNGGESSAPGDMAPEPAAAASSPGTKDGSA